MSEQRARHRPPRIVRSRTRGNIQSTQHDSSDEVKNTTKGSNTDTLSNNGACDNDHISSQNYSRGHDLSKSIPANAHNLPQFNTIGSSSSLKKVRNNVDWSEQNTLNVVEAEERAHKNSNSKEENRRKNMDDDENNTNKNVAMSKCIDSYVKTNTSPMSRVSKTESAYKRQINSDGINDIPTKTLYNRVKRYQGKLGNLRRQGHTKGDQINTIKQVIADIQNELEERRLAERNKKETKNTYDIDDEEHNPIHTNTSNDLFHSKTPETKVSLSSAKSNAENLNINEDTRQDALESVEIELLFNGIENLLEVKERPKIQRGNTKAAWYGTNDHNTPDGIVCKKEKCTQSTGTRCEARNSTTSVKNNLLNNSKVLGDTQNTESKQKEPKVNEVYRFMVRNMDGKGRPEMVASRSGLFPQQYDTENVQSWFEVNANRFTLIKRNGQLTYVLVLKKNCKVCVAYTSEKGCANLELCHSFHICRDFLSGYCKNEGTVCKYSHDISDDYNIKPSRRMGYSKMFNKNEILSVLRTRCPLVCQIWNNAGCYELNCSKMHICQKYIEGTCFEGKWCVFSHDRFSEHNKPIVDAYAMGHWNGKMFWKTVVIERQPPKVTLYRGKGIHSTRRNTSITTTHAKREDTGINSMVSEGTQDDTVICEVDLSSDCSDTQCRLYHNRHTKLPYVWQVKLFGDWIILGREEIQENVERNYCNLKDMSATYLVTYKGVTTTVIIEFNNNRIYGYMKVDKDDTYKPIEARRISTPSYAKGSNSSSRFATEWRWYRKDDGGEWSHYEEDTMQYTLETKYLAGQTEFSSTRGYFKHQYVIDFQRMTQTDQSTKKCRDILRRPLLLTSSDVRYGRTAPKLRPLSVIEVPQPSDWVPWDHTSNFELVRLPSESRPYKDTIGKFFRTMSAHDVEVDCVYRVQSHALWDEFCRTEKHMTASLERTQQRKGLDRRDLFHDAASMEDVRRICTHNFDQNLIVSIDNEYGNGVFFARDARYSDKFTEGPTRLVFLAHVLVGQFTRDDREYCRPPLIPGSRVGEYDSCVDNLHNPSIFRLFEKNQYYPAYLIQYKHREKYIDETRSHISSSQQSINLKHTPSTRSYYGPRPPSPSPRKRPAPSPPPSRNMFIRTTLATARANASEFSGSTRSDSFGETIRSSYRTSYHPPSPPINRSRPSPQSVALGHQLQSTGSSQGHPLDQSNQHSPSLFHSDTQFTSRSTGATGSVTRGSQKLPCGCSVKSPPSQSPPPKYVSKIVIASRPSSQQTSYSPLSTTHASPRTAQGNPPSRPLTQATNVPRAPTTRAIPQQPLPSTDKPQKKKRCSIM